ncbi:MAG: proton-conducting transporter membrane subunit [Andreesenia angusta]|nr:proton-conducting transporter membrane subunit [Andreesenia angusta]
MENLYILVPIVFPFIIAFMVLLRSFDTRVLRNIMVVTLVLCNFFLVLLLGKFQGQELFLMSFNENINLFLKVDKFAIFFATMASFLWSIATVYSTKYMEHEGREKAFFFFYMTTLGITMGIALSGSLFTLYMFYELLTLSTYPLVIHSRTDAALSSGIKYLVYSFIGATFIITGMILLYQYTNTLDFSPMGIFGENLSADIEKKKLMAIYVLLFLGFGVKAALAPFHAWLPNAMVAPTPVSALLHAVAVVKSGIFGLVRISYFIFTPVLISVIEADVFINILIGITILMGSILALHHDNLKKRLAYSTISQLGYIILGISLLNHNAFIGGMLHLINHAFIKIVLFFCAGSIYLASGKTKISEIRGIGRKMPVTMICFAIASFSLVGIPPTNGFVSKWYLALGGLEGNKLLFVIILLISAFLTAAYLLPIVVTAFLPAKEMDHNLEEFKDVKESPFPMIYSIVLLTIIVLILGIFPNPIISFIDEIASNIIWR